MCVILWSPKNQPREGRIHTCIPLVYSIIVFHHHTLKPFEFTGRLFDDLRKTAAAKAALRRNGLLAVGTNLSRTKRLEACKASSLFLCRNMLLYVIVKTKRGFLLFLEIR